MLNVMIENLLSSFSSSLFNSYPINAHSGQNQPDNFEEIF